MRPFVFLFVTVAFASIQAPVLLEHETPVTQTFLGKQWTRIFSCNGPSVDVLSNIQELARTATQVLITENGSTGRFVYSQPESYPIKRLRAGQTLSFQVPPAATAYASQAVINQNWVGPADLLARLWNSCGSASQVTAPNGVLYWACNNVNGLHLGNNGATCMWNWINRAVQTWNVEIYIDAGSRPDPGCETCRGYEGKRWTRIFSCTPSASQFGFSVSDTVALAQRASQVLINNQYDDYVTSNPGSYPIQQLRLGNTISFPTDPTNKYAEKPDIAANWKGPAFLLESLWNTCGSAGDMTKTLYWACNNEGGLHLTTGHCEWDWQAPNGPIEVFVDAPCSCPNDQPPPPPPPSGESQYAPPAGGYGYGSY
jgi:hypothetical protein